jgi:uncharacterized protein
MTFDTAKSAISLALNLKNPLAEDQSIGVIFFGGEPLLKRDLITQIVHHCKEIEDETGQSFHFKITTNGTFLDESFLTSSDTSDIFVALSHDGVQAAHDANRVDITDNGTFNRLSPTIDLLLRHKPYSPVMMIVTPHTVQHFAESVEYLFDRGFRYIISTLNYGMEWNKKQLAELKKQYKRLAEWYYYATKNEEKFYFSPFEVKISSHIFPGSCRADRCELGSTQVSIAPDGTIYPCVQFVEDRSYAIGHVLTGIDQAARAELYKINAEEKESCASCAIRERCNHYCGCLNKQSTGRIDQVSPLLCAHERIILPIADQLAAHLFKDRNPLFIQKHYNEMYPLISLVEDTVTRRST